jgi:enterochelin esterase family protein
MHQFSFLTCLLLLASLTAAFAESDYPLGPDSLVQEGVPKGTLSKYEWKSEIFAGTVRDYWVYIPAQYKADTPTAVMVFQDGGGFVNEKGSYRAPTVLDNLIHKKEIPPVIGIFINPGDKPKDGKRNAKPSNRSFEYDTLSDQYARFLLEEMLPEVSKTVNLSNDPQQRAICGNSSGGICAFTVAWQRPDHFRKVLSHIGSFTNIAAGKTLMEGGHNYPALIRKTPAKPLRVFLQDGSGDLDNAHGNWPLANLQMEAALKFAKYDYKTVWGDGGHNGKHGGSIFPDSMGWLWRPQSD